MRFAADCIVAVDARGVGLIVSEEHLGIRGTVEKAPADRIFEDQIVQPCRGAVIKAKHRVIAVRAS